MTGRGKGKVNFCNCNQGRLPCACKSHQGAATAAATADNYKAERDALQLLMTERDDRIDLLEVLLREVSIRANLMGWESGLIESIDSALKSDSDITGYDYRNDLGAYFGLSYASWLTLPRVLMQAMPTHWQRRAARLLHEYSDAIKNPPDYGTTVRVKLSGKMIKTPAWLINYRHPDHEMIAQVLGTRAVKS